MKKTNAIRILDQQKIEYELVPYAYDETNLQVEQIASNLGIDLHLIYKSLMLKGNKTGLICALIPGNKNLSFKSLANASYNKKVTMLPVKEIESFTGYIRGGCSPIGIKKPAIIYLDSYAEKLNHLYINAGKRGLLIKIKVTDLIQVTQASLANLVQKD